MLVFFVTLYFRCLYCHYGSCMPSLYKPLHQTRSQGGFGGGGGSVEPPFQGAGSEFLIKEATPPHTVNTVLTLFAELSGCSARLTTVHCCWYCHYELETIYSRAPKSTFSPYWLVHTGSICVLHPRAFSITFPGN